jgi:hypothetical protein
MLQNNMSRVEQIRKKHKKRMAKIEEVRRAANRKALLDGVCNPVRNVF